MSSSAASTHLSHPALKLLIGPQPATVRGAALHFGKHPTLPKIIYPSGKYIVVRDLEDPANFFIYRGHNFNTSCAKFSPNGYWVASGDASGRVRVWSWDNPEHILKLEVQVFSGEVKDLDWDPESKKILAVGEGQGTNAKVFMWDTGNSVGELNGHGKRVISCAYRPCRPFRLITASEDTRSVFYAGPPFVLAHSNIEHSNFVNCVRYSPDGKYIGTVGSDKKIIFYDGATGQYLSEIPDAHSGSIYSIAFSPDGKHIATSSADKTVKVWHVETKAVVQSWAWDGDIADMQNGVLWLDDQQLISVSLDGDINRLTLTDTTSKSLLQGHQVTVTALAVPSPGALHSFYTSSYDGVVNAWLKEKGRATRFVGGASTSSRTIINRANHAGKITGCVVSCAGQVLKSVGFDDQLRIAQLETLCYQETEGLPLPGQPISIASPGPSSDLVSIIYRPQGIISYRGATVATQEKVSDCTSLPFTPSALAHFGEEEIAIGALNHKIYLYEAFSFDAPAAVIEGPRGEISAISYCPDGRFLAVGDSNREVSVYERGKGWTAKVQGLWVHHTSRVTSLAWDPSGEYLASGSSDSNVIVWSINNPKSRISFDGAHKDGVTVVGWLSEKQLLSAGNDAAIAIWDIPEAGLR